MRFSQRIGKAKVQTELQVDGMDRDLRVVLWNLFKKHYLDKVDKKRIENSEFNLFFEILWAGFFKRPLEELRYDLPQLAEEIRQWFFAAEWFEVYDFIEFVPDVNAPSDAQAFRAACNQALEKELSGYRFVGKELVPITSPFEIQEILGALQAAQRTPAGEARRHLESSLAALADRKNPKYGESVAESIAAVDEALRAIGGNGATLESVCRALEEKKQLASEMTLAFAALYTAARALAGAGKAGFDEARFVLMVSTSLMNYLLPAAAKAGIVKEQ